MNQQEFFQTRIQEEERAKHHLTSAQRSTMIKELRDWAPDAVLVAAVRQSRFHYMWLKDLELPAPDAAPAKETNDPALGREIVMEFGPFPVVRGNVDPGTSSITKIGSKTKDELLRTLAQEKIPAAKYSEHLKLLWSRGEIKFDGEKYYV